MQHVNKLMFIAAMLMLLALSLTGCASKPYQPPVASPTLELPKPPSVNTQLPQTSYSITASENIKAWRLRLKGTRMMSEP